MSHLRFGLLLSFCLTVAACAGCGPDGPERYSVSGKITLNGEPVPAGEVAFEPDATQGNLGPQSRAEIIDGRYETMRGKGLVPGAVFVTIKPYDGVPTSEDRFGKPLHKTVQIHFEMPRADLERDFEVTEGKSN